MMSTTSRRHILKNKKGLHEQYRLLRRPTFSDLLGPVRLYRIDRFTSKILEHYRDNDRRCQMKFFEVNHRDELHRRLVTGGAV